MRSRCSTRVRLRAARDAVRVDGPAEVRRPLVNSSDGCAQRRIRCSTRGAAVCSSSCLRSRRTRRRARRSCCSLSTRASRRRARWRRREMPAEEVVRQWWLPRPVGCAQDSTRVLGGVPLVTVLAQALVNATDAQRVVGDGRGVISRRARWPAQRDERVLGGGHEALEALNVSLADQIPPNAKAPLAAAPTDPQELVREGSRIVLEACGVHLGLPLIVSNASLCDDDLMGIESPRPDRGVRRRRLPRAAAHSRLRACAWRWALRRSRRSTCRWGS